MYFNGNTALLYDMHFYYTTQTTFGTNEVMLNLDSLG